MSFTHFSLIDVTAEPASAVLLLVGTIADDCPSVAPGIAGDQLLDVTGIVEHTLFVITADHTNALTLPEYTNSRGLYEVPVAFYHPQMPAEKRNEVICQADIMPSILGFLGYDEPYFAFGEDALTRPKTHPYAVCYNATVFQIFSDSLLVQFDGEHVTGVYDYRHDHWLRANIVNTADKQRIAPMIDYLKAYIQQYTHRMVHDQLTTE